MAYQPAPLSVLTLNCRGLNIPERRTHLLRELRKRHASVAMLQETHFRFGAAPTLRNKFYPTNHFCNHPTARKAGVAILLSADLEFQTLDTVTDTHGRYLFLKGVIAEHTGKIERLLGGHPNPRRRLQCPTGPHSGLLHGAQQHLTIAFTSNPEDSGQYGPRRLLENA
ncbi:Hypothetical predicted protein [Pelobates cultripes]|uniref:Endonuclease/exonuclease/phosphatase domain-containing protein n=1 Tax=Pelobates cultripes TaxID=61616 RepID=A0AAD1R239_PELCU|nr:Hypothetical predicted protein [Pelobates cultripes]